MCVFKWNPYLMFMVVWGNLLYGNLITYSLNEILLAVLLSNLILNQNVYIRCMLCHAFVSLYNCTGVSI